MSETSGHEYLQSHQISGEVIALDLNREADEILASASSSNSGVAAKTLIKEGRLRVVIIGLRSGATLRDHQAGGPVCIQAIKGAVEVASDNRTDALEAGKALVLDASVSHSVTARADAVLLLTIAWLDQ